VYRPRVCEPAKLVCFATFRALFPPHSPTPTRLWFASLDLMSRSISSIIYHLIFAILRIVALGFIGYAAYSVRMHAINIYGLVIHEFDPWFNFRATQYLADNGVEKFFHWFDYMSWSPLGRPVGTTIYPGMQLLSVYLWKLLNHLGLAISLNDVCCYVPVWGGITATMLIGATTYVSTGSANAAVFASAVMSVIPAHIMRSVGGGFDNESVAISALCLTFLFWTYSLSGKDNNKPSYIGGILTGLAYICMVASWGGYVFVCNVIALHAFVLVFFGRFSNKLYWAYTLWYIIGTTGAIQVPVVGLTPLKSLEQMAPLGVFFMMQALQFCELSLVLKAFGVKNPSKVTTLQRLKVRAVIFFFAGLAGAAVVYVLWPTGYFGPLSARIRGLFVQHTRTGNPLVDSVAEHQPASPEAFWQFLHYSCHSSPIGFGLVVLKGVILPLIRSQKRLDSTDRSTDPLLFIITYASVTYFFATKMNRLMLLMGPVSAMLSGVALGFMFDFVLNEIFELLSNFFSLFSSSSSSSSDKDEDKKETEQEKEKEETEVPEKKVSEESSNNNNKSNKSSSTLKKRKTDKSSGKDANEASSSSSAKDTTKEDKEEKPKEKKAKKGTSATSASATTMDWIEDKLFQFYSFSLIRLVRLALAGGMVYIVYLDAPEFYKYSTEMAGHLSHPSIMFQARLRDGTEIMVDDYREAYWWLRDNTPEDSRVMAWWDYGYQITGIGNRTTIADGNTWNHEVCAHLLPSTPSLSPSSLLFTVSPPLPLLGFSPLLILPSPHSLLLSSP
jgi:dolichyl-diphosphooligosaccharide---protein glycosyltransferase